MAVPKWHLLLLLFCQIAFLAVPALCAAEPAERARRDADTAGVDPGEVHMARGDLLWVGMDHKQAGTAYEQATAQARDPGLKYAAWNAYAQCAPARAWEMRNQIEPLFAGDAPPVARAEFLDTALLTGIAAGKVNTALMWVTEAMTSAFEVKPGPELLGKLMVLLLITDQSDAAREVLESAGDDYETAKVLGAVLCVGSENRRALFGRSGGLAQAAESALDDQLDPAAVWHAAAELAITGVKDFEQAGPSSSLWWALVQAPPLTEPEQRDAALAALGRFVDAALAWVDARTRGHTLAVTNLLECAGTPLSRQHGLVVLPECQRLFLGCLERGQARGVSPNAVAPRLQAYRKQLRRYKAPADALSALGDAVTAHYPTLVRPTQ